MEVLESGVLETLRAEAARDQAEAEALGTRKKDKTRRPRQTASQDTTNVTSAPTIMVQGADGESIVLPPLEPRIWTVQRLVGGWRCR